MTPKTPQQTEAELADDYLKGAVLGRKVSQKALELALKQAENGTLKNPASAAMQAATASGILLDKRLLLQARPTQITQHLDPAAEGRALAKQLGITVDSTATEIPDAKAIGPPANPLPLKYPSATEAHSSEEL